jgi:hypothetical protein
MAHSNQDTGNELDGMMARLEKLWRQIVPVSGLELAYDRGNVSHEEYRSTIEHNRSIDEAVRQEVKAFRSLAGSDAAGFSAWLGGKRSRLGLATDAIRHEKPPRKNPLFTSLEILEIMAPALTIVPESEKLASQLFELHKLETTVDKVIAEFERQGLDLPSGLRARPAPAPVPAPAEALPEPPQPLFQCTPPPGAHPLPGVDELMAKHGSLRPIAPLIKTAQDLESFTTLLAKDLKKQYYLLENHAEEMPELPGILGVDSFTAVCDFLQKVFANMPRLNYIEQKVWVEWLRKGVATLPKDLDRRLDWLAKLQRYYELLPGGCGFISSAEDAERVIAACAQLLNRSYGYSDADLDMKGYMPKVFAWTAHLVARVDGFERLCAAVPALIRSLPGESEATMIGWVHTYDGSRMEAIARTAEDLDQFLAACL